MQPKTRTIRYDNVKSAMAEEGVIALGLRDPALLDHCGGLKGADFSVELLGRVFDVLVMRHSQGLEVSLSVLEDLTPEEMSHLAGITQRQQGPVSQEAFTDCVNTIRGVRQKKNIASNDDLLAFRDKLRESKGTK